MTVAGNLPKHLEVAARTGVLGARARDDMPYRMVATEVDLTATTTTFVDLGGMPIPTRNARQVETMIEKGKTVEPEDWYLTLNISKNAINDDQTGSLLRQFRGVLPAFQRHINSHAFTVLNAGDAATYGLGLTGSNLFANNQIYTGAKYQTAQDNLNSLALSLDNFNSVWVAARQFRDDQGNFYNNPFNLLVTSIALNQVGFNIAGNPNAYDTANQELNPYRGTQHLAVPEFDSTAWVLIADSDAAGAKPLYVAIRQRPQLNGAPWFDPQAGDGGMWYFPYHARYVIGYGDNLLATMGNS
ncbi:MAG: Mu-like prophage major head subunit gpT family protein [Anaerolineales bacterium]|nr:Mu-like prophage major head subunit gpT family protein [Anaerolineales bacterium]